MVTAMVLKGTVMVDVALFLCIDRCPTGPGYAKKTETGKRHAANGTRHDAKTEDTVVIISCTDQVD